MPFLAVPQQQVPWADLQYLFGEVMYGGHVFNDWCGNGPLSLFTDCLSA
eukprot:SAG22_NODE_4356_length_1293_cov_2.071189_1_plen_48_part_10